LKRILLFYLVIFSLSGLNAQDLSNLRKREILITGDSLIIDSLSIVPGSLFIFDKNNLLLPDSLYSIDNPSSELKFDTCLLGMTVTLNYRVFHTNFLKPFARKDTSIINPYLKPGKDPFRISASDLRPENELLPDEIDKRGSISRGISIGNNEDMVINSNLNLQLTGKISEDLNIAAAISDNNIPIQPDGTAQNIYEFDRVYIEIFNESFSLLAGDFDLEGSPGNFLKFYKKGKGARFSGKFYLNDDKSATLRTTVSGSISKGQVWRNSFNGREGSQGPYKLRGKNNEQYIIVLAGSERVYIDGKIQSRGLENDYTIDYNNAEITFTPNQLITKDKRIIVEFEYSEKSYARFLVYNSNEFITQKSDFWINIYSEQDDKNQTLQQDLSDSDKRLLAETGDNLNLAVVPRIDSVGFNTSEVLYKKFDTLISGTFYKDVYVYSTNSDSARYRLGFSYVGQGNGNYINIRSSANGKVYRWVEPAGGTPRGDYEPVILLVTPKKKQVITTGVRTAITPYTLIFGEASLTNNNLNTFSHRDMDDNIGYALKGGIVQEILHSDTTRTRLKLTGTYQFLNRNFDPVERFRPVEFDRDWNIMNSHSGFNEHLAGISIDFSRRDFGGIGIQTEYLNRENIYRGLRNTFKGLARWKGFNLNFNGSLMTSNDSILSTRFLRHQALLSKQIKSVVIGIREESEQNIWSSTATDTIQNNSFRYFQYEIYLASPDTAKNGFLVNYLNRQDFLPGQNEIVHATTGRDFNFGFRLGKNPDHRLKTLLIYRMLEVNDTALSDTKADRSLIGRMEHSLSLLKGGLTGSVFYEIGSGLEAKKEFTYLEVSPGQGVYTWTDYNGNNVRELDEFEIAAFQDQAKFIRVFTPTEALLNVYTNQFNLSYQVQPVNFWRDKTGFRKFVSSFSDQFAYSINRKNTDKDLIGNINPFYTDLDNPGLTTLSTSIRNNLSYNRSGQKFGADYIFLKNSNRILLANGFDTRSAISHGTRIRFSPGNIFSFINQTDLGRKKFESEFFSSRDFDIEFVTNDLSFQYQPGISFRIILKYLFSNENNRSGKEKSDKHDISCETRYSILNKGTVMGKLSYIRIKYNEDPNTPVAYEMLNGLQPGNNGIWEATFQRSLTGGLEMSINYTGRVSGKQKVIHYGGVQVRWNF
jgi:hypothetical protein